MTNCPMDPRFIGPLTLCQLLALQCVQFFQTLDRYLDNPHRDKAAIDIAVLGLQVLRHELLPLPRRA